MLDVSREQCCGTLAHFRSLRFVEGLLMACSVIVNDAQSFGSGSSRDFQACLHRERQVLCPSQSALFLLFLAK